MIFRIVTFTGVAYTLEKTVGAGTAIVTNILPNFTLAPNCYRVYLDNDTTIDIYRPVEVWDNPYLQNLTKSI
jgi:hypothetical protein